MSEKCNLAPESAPLSRGHVSAARVKNLAIEREYAVQHRDLFTLRATVADATPFAIEETGDGEIDTFAVVARRWVYPAFFGGGSGMLLWASWPTYTKLLAALAIGAHVPPMMIAMGVVVGGLIIAGAILALWSFIASFQEKTA